MPAKVIRETGLAESDFSIAINNENVKHYDICIFQRSSDERILNIVRTAKGMKRPVLYEIDDDLFDIPRSNPAGRYYDYKRKKVAIDIIKECDGVIVTTETLKQKVSAWNRNVYVIPNYIDRGQWADIKRQENQKLQLGWAGTATHYDDLNICLPVLKQMFEQYDVGLTFVGWIPPQLHDIKDKIRFIPFGDYSVYPQKLASIDIGIAPIVDNQFNRSKSDIKVLEYGALGIPCVASRVDNYIRAANDGAGVLLASNGSDWIKHLKRLITDKLFRQSLAMKGEMWSGTRDIRNHASEWVQICGEILEKYPSCEEQFGSLPTGRLYQTKESLMELKYAERKREPQTEIKRDPFGYALGSRRSVS